jgi:AbrB family looped-hinge helix DNA binding protein
LAGKFSPLKRLPLSEGLVAALFFDRKMMGDAEMMKEKIKGRYEVTLGNRGRVTIPHAIRNALGIQPGDKLLFERDENGFLLIPIKETSLFRRYRGIGNPGIPHGRRGINYWLRTLRGE